MIKFGDCFLTLGQLALSFGVGAVVCLAGATVVIKIMERLEGTYIEFPPLLDKIIAVVSLIFIAAVVIVGLTALGLEILGYCK